MRKTLAKRYAGGRGAPARSNRRNSLCILAVRILATGLGVSSLMSAGPIPCESRWRLQLIVLVPRPRLPVLEGSPLRFRLVNLLYLTAVVAIVAMMWAQFVQPNVSQVFVNESGVVIWMSDSWHEWMGFAYYDDETGELVDPRRGIDGLLMHDSYMRIPWSPIIGIAVSILLIDLGLHYLFRRCRRRGKQCCNQTT